MYVCMYLLRFQSVVGMKERRLDSVCGGSEGAWMMDSGRTALVGWS